MLVYDCIAFPLLLLAFCATILLHMIFTLTFVTLLCVHVPGVGKYDVEDFSTTFEKWRVNGLRLYTWMQNENTKQYTAR